MIPADPMPEAEAVDKVEPEKLKLAVLVTPRHRCRLYLSSKRTPLRPCDPLGQQAKLNCYTVVALVLHKFSIRLQQAAGIDVYRRGADVTRIEVVAKQEKRKRLDVYLLIIPDEVEVCLLGYDDGALNEALPMQGADEVKAACEPEKGEDIVEAGNIELGREVPGKMRRGDVVRAW